MHKTQLLLPRLNLTYSGIRVDPEEPTSNGGFVGGDGGARGAFTTSSFKCAYTQIKGLGKCYRWFVLDSDLSSTPQPNTEVHSGVLRSGT